MTPAQEAVLARLRAIALALPCAAEKTSHGMQVFGIEGGRLFAQYWPNHHDVRRDGIMVKTSGPEEQALLIDADPDAYYRPAYIGHSGWIAIRTDLGDVDWAHVADRVAASWRMVAPRKLVEDQGR